MAQDSFETVAIVYSQPELAVMRSMFAFYGIPTFAVGQGHASVLPTWMVALGGVQVRVAADAAADARALLSEVAERPQAVRPYLIRNRWLNGVVVVLAWMFLFMPVPPTRTGSTYL